LTAMPQAVFAAEICAGRADKAVHCRIAVVGAVVIGTVPAMAGMRVRIVVAVGVTRIVALGIGPKCNRSLRPGKGRVVPAIVPDAI